MFEELKIKATARAEELTLEQFSKIANYITKKKKEKK